MSKNAQNVFKGMNAQVWAAMSLFLQYLREPAFSHIHFEAPGFEDFNLVFNDGKKIICESKDRKRPFGFSDLKKVLGGLVKKKVVLGDEDEILVICSNLDDEFAGKVRAVKYFVEVHNDFKKHKYTDVEIGMLSKVRFWRIPAEMNERLVCSLFAELINFWLPYDDVEKITKSILVEKIYAGSAKGGQYSKEDILSDIERLRKETVKKGGHFDDERIKIESQIRNLVDALDNNQSPVWAPNQLSALSSKPTLIFFVLDRFKEKQIDNLEDWNDLWQLYSIYRFSFSLFHIFENNLHTDSNRKYVINFLKNHVGEIRRFYQHDFFNTDVVKIAQKVIKDDPKFLSDTFEIVKKLLTDSSEKFFYLKTLSPSDSWERGQICKLLYAIYSHSNANAALKAGVIDLILNVFNITEDDGEFNWHAPKEVYQMLYDWLNEDFPTRFNELVNTISNQYDRYYQKFGSKIKFKGWEHMGGGTSFGPGGYLTGDRHFISYILAPAIKEYYGQDKRKGWQFVKKNCVASAKEVSKSRPDFLNRAVIEVVLNRYLDTDTRKSKEAFGILKEFILSKRGIPHKSNLIYQAIVGRKMSDIKKWELVNLTVKKYGVPVNPFAEQIVANLAKSGYQPAKETIKKWFKNPKYYKHLRFDRDAISTISALLDSDLDFAIELFKSLVTSEYIKSDDSEHFSAYKVAELLYEIFKRNYEKGLSIIRILEKEGVLSDDQQIIFAYSLFSHAGNDGFDDVVLLMKIYQDVVDPFLNKNKDDINKIVQRFSHAHCRDAFVQFATRLATKEKIAEAIRIVEIFIDDPDPYLPGKDPEDSKDQYNEHKKIEEGEEPHSITSTRGWCGWTLMKCSVLAGRDHISEIIQLTRKLVGDENYYVVHMGTFALHQIAVNRLTVLPKDKKDKNTLFFNNDKKTALKMAKEVESISFDLLERFVTWPEKTQEAMAKSVIRVFDSIRALNKRDTLKLLNTLSKLHVEAIQEAAPLFLFYAEIRAEGYKDWRFTLPGLYDDLIIKKTDAKEFKAIAKKAIEKVQRENPDEAFRFASSAEHLMRGGWRNQTERERYTRIALEYFDLVTNAYAHNIFSLVYRTAKDKIASDDKCLNKWYALLKKCFEIEEKFYKKQERDGNIQNVYWYASLHHSEVLETIYEKLGEKKFMDIAKIVFLEFPKGINLHESDHLVSIIEALRKKNNDAERIIKRLVDINPSKYWDKRK